jgi:hypothetical protein
MSEVAREACEKDGLLPGSKVGMSGTFGSGKTSGPFLVDGEYFGLSKRPTSPSLLTQNQTAKMVGLVNKKRKANDRDRERAPRLKKKFKKQTDYHSSDSDASEDEGFAPVNLQDSDDEGAKISASGELTGSNAAPLGDGGTSDEDGSTNDDSSGESGDNNVGQDAITKRLKKTSKRNDPEAFSTSISKILSTKLSHSARKDPVLSRSREAAETSKELADQRLEKKARAKIRADRKEDLERGRVKDVLGLTSGLAGETAEEEKRLRKIAQRGVIKLFNAVRAAQVKGEEAAREARKQGTVGVVNREEKVNEMSKQGFLDLINGKNKKKIEEA